MSDTCWLTVTVHALDAEKLRQWVDEPEEIREPQNGHPVWVWEEADRGFENELREAAVAGRCRFNAFHGPGDEYDREVYASAGDGRFYVVACDDECRPLVAVRMSGHVDAQELKRARAYLRAYRQTEKLFAEPAVVTALRELAVEFDEGRNLIPTKQEFKTPVDRLKEIADEEAK